MRKDLLIFLLFVGLVSIFWWGRALSSPREVDIRVPISYEGELEKIVWEQELPSNLRIKIRDNGKQLRHINAQDLHLTLDLSPYLKEDKGHLHITSDMLRPRLQDMLPGSTSIQYIAPESIEANFYISQHKNVPIGVRSHLTIAPQHQLVGNATISPNQVQVFGNQEIINNIDTIWTDSISLSDLRSNTIVTAALKVPAGTRVHPGSVKVGWQVEQFTDKSFTLPIHVVDVPAGEHIRLFPEDVNVTVRVGISHFADITADELHVTCHYPQEPSNVLPLEVTTINPHISNIRVSPAAVEYIIEQVAHEEDSNG